MGISKIISDPAGTPVGSQFSQSTHFDAYAHSTVATYGSYQEVFGSTDEESRGIIWQISDNGTHEYVYQVAVGAASSEVVIGQFEKRGGNPNKLVLGEISVKIDKGSRVAVRAKRSTAGAGISQGNMAIVAAGT